MKKDRLLDQELRSDIDGRSYNPGHKCKWCCVSTAERKLKDGFCRYCFVKHKREYEAWKIADGLLFCNDKRKLIKSYYLNLPTAKKRDNLL